MKYQGRIKDFHLGGGGGVAQKVMCQHAHHERQGPLKGPGSSRVVLMVSRAI